MQDIPEAYQESGRPLLDSNSRTLLSVYVALRYSRVLTATIFGSFSICAFQDDSFTTLQFMIRSL